MALKVPNSPATNTIVYNDLKGVDFSQDASLIDRRHSPDMLNMISDEGGNPVKRKGWEELFTLEDFESATKITNMWSFTIDGVTSILVEAESSHTTGGYQIYKSVVTYAGDEVVLSSPVSIHSGIYKANCAFYYKTVKEEVAYFFFDSEDTWLGVYGAYKYNGTTLEPQAPKTPTIVISRPPDGNGGTFYEDINLLNCYCTEQFIVTGSAASTFKLAKKADDETLISIEVLDASGTWGEWLGGDAHLGADGVTVTLTNPISPTPLDGEDNVRITHSFPRSNTIPLSKCTNYAFFSQGTSDHVFMTGSAGEKNTVWYSAIGDPTYFPDTNYLYFGSDEGECMGFLPVQGNLAVLKSEPRNGTASLYLIYDTSISSTTVSSTNATTGETRTNTEQVYTYAVKRIATAVGAVSKNGFALLGDEPLFLSKHGLYGITSLNATADKAVTNRSRSIDRKLAAEDLSEAQVITHNNYLYVFVNNHVYVFDGRQKSADRKNNTSYFYEAYYWDNVPAKKVCVVNDNLYFINDNQLCRFKNRGELTDYSDGSTIVNGEVTGGVPIVARWSTKSDDDGLPQYFKTMMKKGSMITLAPYERSSVKAYARPDGYFAKDANGNPIARYYIGEFYADIWHSFEYIDFSRFTFDTRTAPRDIFFRKKKKKYVRLQLVFENDALNEGFGIHQVVKTITATRFAK